MEPVWVIAAAVIGVVCGVGVALALTRKQTSQLRAENERKTSEADQARADRESARTATSEAEKRVSALEAQLNERGVAHERIIQAYKDAEASMDARFGDVAKHAYKEALKERDELTESDVDQRALAIENMLKPVGKTLEQLQKQIVDTNTERARAEGAITALIEKSAGINEKLANALSKPVIRGSWAETKLEVLLEAAGLVKDEDFETQVRVQDGDETRIVDALVNMGSGRRLVIDSKNLIQNYVAYDSEEDGAKKAELLEAFKGSFKAILRNLSLKDYAKHWDGVDMVIMFLPDEGMFMTAMETDRRLVASMHEHRVFVVNPTTLASVLRSVAYILGLERQNKNTEEIVKAGRELYASLGTLQGKVVGVGEKLEQGVRAYNELIASFEGNVLPKTRTLNRLDVKRGPEHKDIGELESDVRKFKEKTVLELATSSYALAELADSGATSALSDEVETVEPIPVPEAD